MKKSKTIMKVIAEYALLTVAAALYSIGIYVFCFPNNFSLGGVTGISVLLSAILPIPPSMVTLVLNILLLIIGVIFLGKSFGIKTAYTTVVLSLFISAGEFLFPLDAPLTGEPTLELIFAITLPALAAAMLFNMNASSGGTEIIAMILSKYTSLNIGTTLLIADAVVAVSAFFIFGAEIGLYSICGLLAKSLVVDGVIENINLCKVFTIICDKPEPICEYINSKLNRGATIQSATGAYTHNDKFVVITMLSRRQAVELRNFIRVNEPNAFIAITNSSEIIGKGFSS